jgi:hypothetical protein
MKKLIVILLAVVIAFSVSAPVFAKSESTQGANGIYTLVGTITAIDSVNKTVTVHILRSNLLARPYKGTDVVLTTLETTKFLEKDGVITTAIKFEDLVVGDVVSSRGKLVDGLWKAWRITVNPLLLHP